MSRPGTPRRATFSPALARPYSGPSGLATYARAASNTGIATPIIPSVFLEADRLADRGRTDGAALQTTSNRQIGAAIYHQERQHLHAASRVAVDPQFPLVDMAMRNLHGSRAPSPSVRRQNALAPLAATPARGFAALASKCAPPAAPAVRMAEPAAADAHGWTRHQHAGRDIRSALPHFGGAAPPPADMVFAIDDLLRAQRQPEPTPTMEQLEALTLELRDARAAAASAMEMAQHAEHQVRAEAARREREAAAEAQRHAERMQLELREAERRARDADEQRQRLAQELERQRAQEQQRLDEAARAIERAVLARVEAVAACQRLESAETEVRRETRRQEEEDRRRLLGAAAIVPAAIEAEAASRRAAAAHEATLGVAAGAAEASLAVAAENAAQELARSIAADAEAVAAHGHLRDAIADSTLRDCDADGGEALRLMQHLRVNVLRRQPVSPPACPSIVSQVASCGSSFAALEDISDIADGAPPDAALLSDRDAPLPAVIMPDPMSVGRDARVQLLLRRSADLGRAPYHHDAHSVPRASEFGTPADMQHPHYTVMTPRWAAQQTESIDVSGLSSRPWSPPRPVATFVDAGGNASPARTIAYTASTLVQSPMVAVTGHQ